METLLRGETALATAGRAARDEPGPPRSYSLKFMLSVYVRPFLYALYGWFGVPL
jgi:hypothetical protein